MGTRNISFFSEGNTKLMIYKWMCYAAYEEQVKVMGDYVKRHKSKRRYLSAKNDFVKEIENIT